VGEGRTAGGTSGHSVETYRAAVSFNGHSASGGGGDASAGPVSSAGKGFTIARLADGYGVGGLQDPERPYEFVFMAVLKQACKTSVSIIQ
jgi:hypothetical protein